MNTQLGITKGVDVPKMAKTTVDSLFLKPNLGLAFQRSSFFMAATNNSPVAFWGNFA